MASNAVEDNRLGSFPQHAVVRVLERHKDNADECQQLFAACELLWEASSCSKLAVFLGDSYNASLEGGP